MQTTLFLFWFVLLCFIIAKLKWVKQSGFGVLQLMLVYAVKIIAGIAYAFYYKSPQQIAGADTWRYYNESLAETTLLKQHPLQFFADLFQNNYAKTSNLFIAHNSYWNNLKSNLIIKIMAVFNVLSANNYYTLILFFNFIFLLGIVALCRLALQYFKINTWLLMLAVVGFPSFLFWYSGVHKDGFIFTAIAFSLYSFHSSFRRFLPEKSPTNIEQISHYVRYDVKHIVVLLLSLLLLFAFRNYVCFVVMLSLGFWYMANNSKHHAAKAFTAFNIFLIVLFFASSLLPQHYNLLYYITEKHNEFLLLQGNSKIDVPTLLPTIKSFVLYFPTAINLAFFQPSIFNLNNITYYLFCAEEYALILLLIYAIFLFFKHKNGFNKQQLIFLQMLSIIVFWLMIMVGYSVNLIGAVIRYRGLVIPFIAVIILALLNNKKGEAV